MNATTLPGHVTLLGHTRPVLPVTDTDRSELTAAIASCGLKAVATIAAALESVYHELQHSQDKARPTTAHDYACTALTAGAPQAWQSGTLLQVVWIGVDLNLIPFKKGGDPSRAARRAAGPCNRVDRAARDTIAAIIHRWVTDPDRYTEVAGTLAEVVAAYADSIGAHGWRKISDSWLRPASASRDNFVACYRLLYHQSGHFDRHLI